MKKNSQEPSSEFTANEKQGESFTFATSSNRVINKKYATLCRLLVSISKESNTTDVQQISRRLQILTETIEDVIHAGHAATDQGNVITLISIMDYRNN